MAKYGSIIVEKRIQAYDINAFNRSAKHATADVDGGNLVKLTASATAGDDVWTATTPATGGLGGLWMAYNPSQRLTDVNGLLIAGISADDRDYTNLKTRVFDVFKPKLGDEIAITLEDIDASGADAVVTDYLEGKNGQTKLQRIAHATGITTGSTSFEIIRIETQPYPRAGVGMEFAKKFVCVCVQE